jgi:predicted SAM-dependent methyltransferase
MKLLNVGCGGNRPQDEQWWNLDDLRQSLKLGTPERTNLDNEPRYVNHNLLAEGPMPFEDESFEGCLCSHVIEHFCCNNAVELLKDCRRILKPGGLLVVSVPDADYFLSVHDRDKPENGIELFGEPIHDKWQPTFMAYALFHRSHLQVLTSGSLKCLLIQAGFDRTRIFDWRVNHAHDVTLVRVEIERIVNRTKFSVILHAIKLSSAK